MWDYRPILKIFTKEPTGSFTIRQLSKDSNLAYGTTHKCVVEILSKEKIVTITSLGKSKLVKLNLENPDTARYLAEAEIDILRDYKKNNKKIFQNLNTLLGSLQNALKHSIYSALLFGSYAKGKATSKSDIDLLIIKSETKGKNNEVADIISPWEFEHNIKINPVIQTPEEYIKMLKNKAILPLQIIENHIVLLNSETYWRFTIKGLKND